jgi:small subunit ribosomal protein S4
MLEMRLDTICYTLGYAKSIGQARQFVNHGHITVNKKVVNIPSFQCRLNDIISVKENSTSKTLIENNIKNNQSNDIPSNLKFDSTKLEAKILDYCDRDDMILQLDELLVIEHYSRR